MIKENKIGIDRGTKERLQRLFAIWAYRD